MSRKTNKIKGRLLAAEAEARKARREAGAATSKLIAAGIALAAAEDALNRRAALTITLDVPDQIVRYDTKRFRLDWSMSAFDFDFHRRMDPDLGRFCHYHAREVAEKFERALLDYLSGNKEAFRA